jgi:hypothetical protein
MVSGESGLKKRTPQLQSLLGLGDGLLEVVGALPDLDAAREEPLGQGAHLAALAHSGTCESTSFLTFVLTLVVFGLARRLLLGEDSGW